MASSLNITIREYIELVLLIAVSLVFIEASSKGKNIQYPVVILDKPSSYQLHTLGEVLHLSKLNNAT